MAMLGATSLMNMLAQEHIDGERTGSLVFLIITSVFASPSPFGTVKILF